MSEPTSFLNVVPFGQIAGKLEKWQLTELWEYFSKHDVDRGLKEGIPEAECVFDVRMAACNFWGRDGWSVGHIHSTLNVNWETGEVFLMAGTFGGAFGLYKPKLTSVFTCPTCKRTYKFPWEARQVRFPGNCETCGASNELFQVSYEKDESERFGLDRDWTPEQATKLWNAAIAKALEGKEEDLGHAGFIQCPCCKAVMKLVLLNDYLEHLMLADKLEIRQVLLGTPVRIFLKNGQQIEMRGKTVKLITHEQIQ